MTGAGPDAQPPPAAAPSGSAGEEAAERLWNRIAREHPTLAAAIEFQREASKLLNAASPAAALPATASSAARDLVVDGVPLLAAASPQWTAEPPLPLLASLAALSDRILGTPGAAEIARAARAGDPTLRRFLAASLARDSTMLQGAAAELAVDESVLATLCDLSLAPSLRALAEAALPVAGLLAWTPGYCPICGSWPIFGEIRDAGRARHLRCGLCGADWSFARIACFFCGESQHRRLRALHREGEAEHRRVELCESCRRYVKSLAALRPTPPARLAIEDLATIELDLLALAEGYERPGGRPFEGLPNVGD